MNYKQVTGHTLKQITDARNMLACSLDSTDTEGFEALAVIVDALFTALNKLNTRPKQNEQRPRRAV